MPRRQKNYLTASKTQTLESKMLYIWPLNWLATKADTDLVHYKCKKHLDNKIQRLEFFTVSHIFCQAHIFADTHFLEFKPRGLLFHSRSLDLFHMDLVSASLAFANVSSFYFVKYLLCKPFMGFPSIY